MALLVVILQGCKSTERVEESSVDKIRLNQLGFYPSAPKIAAITSSGENDFYIISPGGKEKIFAGKLNKANHSAYSSKEIQIADFSSFDKPGKYVLFVEGIGESYPFEIKDSIHDALAKAAIKSYYFQRAGMELTEPFAGKWHRPAGHPDTSVLIHASAISEGRPVDFKIASSKGWYDAGDYNKYIVNSGITMGTLLSAFEEYYTYFLNLKLDIPESENVIPDLLDEALWNLRWMLTMQDKDGGVYHKLTNANFDEMVMPDKAGAARYVVKKGTAATLDFAAVMAQAARILKRYEKELPGLSDSCLSASKKAWAWANQNPKMTYDQDQINKQFDPDIVTGAYGDTDFTDEFFWAAAELAITTKEDHYFKLLNNYPDEHIPSWNDVSMLGYYSLLRHEESIAIEFHPLTTFAKNHLVLLADNMIERKNQQPYQNVMGASESDFIWGSSSVAANQGIVLLNAYRASHNRKYLNAALSNLDYLLGRNATGYSFVTGYGHKTPMHIHHRPSEADGIAEPIPGLLSGGPNPGMQDKCSYSSSVPDEAYVDDVCSYASNEVAINWNAPLVYLVCAIEAEQANLK